MLKYTIICPFYRLFLIIYIQAAFIAHLQISLKFLMKLSLFSYNYDKIPYWSMLNKKLQNAVTNNGTNLLYLSCRRFVFWEIFYRQKVARVFRKENFSLLFVDFVFCYRLICIWHKTVCSVQYNAF